MCNHEHFSEFKMAVSAILNFGQCSSFDRDDIEGRIIPLYRGFPGWGVHFWSCFFGYGVKVKVNSEVKGQILPNIRNQITSIDRLYVLLIPEYQGLLGWIGRYMYV